MTKPKIEHTGRRYTLSLTAEDCKELFMSPGIHKFSPRVQMKFRHGLDEFFKRKYYTQEEFDEINALIAKGK